MDKSLWDRADVGGLEGIIRPGSQLGCPEKKKRKLTVQVSTLPHLSEYAPPTNTSSDHLVASNPFDDEYSISPISGYSYFGRPGYSFNTFKMPPNLSPKKSSRNGGLPNFREQPLSFPKEVKSMSLGRTFSFSNMQEKPAFVNESFFSSGLGQTIIMPGQHFRPNHNQEVFHLTDIQSGQRNNFQPSFYRAQGGKMHFIQQPEGCNPFDLVQPHFMHPKTSNYKQETDSASNNNSNLNPTEEKSNPADFSQPIDLQGSDKNTVHSENVQSETIDLTICGPGSGGHRKTSFSKLSKSDVTPREKCNRWLLQSSFCGPLPTDTMYACGVCSVDVNNMGEAIMCEVSCRKWFHRACIGMTEIAYALLTAETSAIWGCDTCMAKSDVQLVRARK